MSRPFFRARALLLLLGPALAAGCDEDLLNPMAAHQPRVQSYGVSEFYDDGMAMREPPAGTVPRERPVRNSALATGKVTGPTGDVYLTSFPVKVDRPLMELGRHRYDIICATCHGPVGDGDSIVARQMALRPPPSLHLYADRAPGYIFEVITRGFGLMASYAAELDVRERWAVVAYVRALQISQATPLDRLSPAERERVMRMGDEPPIPTTPAPGAGGAPARREESP
jgi:mono/diheme cytochrome c family protein